MDTEKEPLYFICPYGERMGPPQSVSSIKELLSQGAISLYTGLEGYGDNSATNVSCVMDLFPDKGASYEDDSASTPDDYVRIIRKGVSVWNAWRNKKPEKYLSIRRDFNEAMLSGINFSKVDLMYSYLIDADFSHADFTGACLRRANLAGADLRGATLVNTDLTYANLSGANLEGAKIINCDIYGISAWNVSLKDAQQINLQINDIGKPKITVDNLKVAQFIHLILNNQEIRDVIDTITSKLILILGRFSPHRKIVLDKIREELQKRNYLPIIFDFEKPSNRDTVETISTLAHMARFVVADLTDAKSVLQELQRIVPMLPSVPIQSIILSSDSEPGMLDHIKNFRTFLEPHIYDDLDSLINQIEPKVIEPAEEKVKELFKRM